MDDTLFTVSAAFDRLDKLFGFFRWKRSSRRLSGEQRKLLLSFRFIRSASILPDLGDPPEEETAQQVRPDSKRNLPVDTALRAFLHGASMPCR